MERAGEIPSGWCEGSEAMNRLTGALIAYLVLGVLTWFTISDSRIRGVTFVILAMFAVKTWLRRNDVMHPDKSSEPE